jgi:hypothetical protein
MKKVIIGTSALAALLTLGGAYLHAQRQSTTAPSVAQEQPLISHAVKPGRITTHNTVPTKAMTATTTPTIATPSVSPNVITINSATTVKLTVTITAPSLITTSVNLLRLNASGSPPTILGQMHDDGRDGDTVAGDHLYTLQAIFNEPTPGQIQLQVSAAFRGMLKRVVSGIVVIDTWATFTSSSGAYTVNVPPSFTTATNTFPLDPTDPLTPISSVTFSGYLSDADTIDEYNIDVIELNSSTTIDRWITDNDDRLFHADRVLMGTTLAGYPAIVATSASEGRLSVFVIVNNKVYEITWAGFGSADIQGSNLFSTFLSTWRPR